MPGDLCLCDLCKLKVKRALDEMQRAVKSGEAGFSEKDEFGQITIGVISCVRLLLIGEKDDVWSWLRRRIEGKEPA